jgi:predicted GNAT family acetyltransferase
MEYQVRHVKEEGCFEIFQDGCIALVKYQMLDRELMHIYHIEIKDTSDCEKIEAKLVTEVLEYARKNHYRVLSSSSSIRDYLQKHPNCQNILL